jgi:hypothetical protein
MMISDEQLDTFIAMYKKKFGEDISRQDAYEEASKLTQMVKVVCFGKEPEKISTVCGSILC